MSVNLDDSTQSVSFIPCAESDDDEENGTREDQIIESFCGDLPDGDEIRWEAYRAAWMKCLERVQTIVHALYEPVVNQVVEKINNAYADTLLGLPQPELPLIAVSNSSSNTSFLAAIVTTLDQQEDTPPFIAHLYPSECPNIMTAMRTLINGFITQSTGQKYATSARSLAPYNIRVLEAWYNKTIGKPREKDARRNLVVVLRDFEQFDPSVMQDIIYICSLHIPKLPLVFVVSLSSPEIPSYLHVAYPRSTLALLRLHRFAVPSSTRLLEEVFMKTFVDLHHDPLLVFGPAVLEFLLDYCTRYNCSLDTLLNILQLAHLKHFTSHIPSLLLLSTPSSSVIKESSSFSFLDSIMARLHTSGDEDKITALEAEVKDWEIGNITSLIKTVESARSEFYCNYRRMRLGFKIIKIIDEFLVSRGYKGLDLERVHGPGMPRVFVALLKGSLARDVKGIRLIISKLRREELANFLDELGHLFDGLPQSLAETETEAADEFERFVKDYNAFEGDNGAESELQNTKQIAGRVGTWLSQYIGQLIDVLETTCFLWDVWYTGMMPFPSETLNPSVKASVISGLLYPKEFAPLLSPVLATALSNGKSKSGKKDEHDSDDEDDEKLWELPDTSILFHRYLESGKMINVYDWFQSFHDVLETQMKEKRRQMAQNASPKKSSASKGKVKGRQEDTARAKGKRKEEPPAGIDVAESEETWNLVVQARFMRALHELDYLGFIKHTGRKPDHVLRTVFDIAD
ncbi:Origin recognition complex subunit 3 [Stygiomarasmius scandens]|uniref:Origin recognition complex subunit 3 n=1 Tax=Marasmiellus scandens TaxID=2682957 RepID=A0ABR1J7X3_9AGAR